MEAEIVLVTLGAAVAAAGIIGAAYRAGDQMMTLLLSGTRAERGLSQEG